VAEDAAAAAQAAASAAAGHGQSAPTSEWRYDTQKDEMRGTTAYYASIDSENQVSVGAPYDDDVARLSVRKRPEDGLNIILRAPGQFLCHSYTEGYVSVKFDGGPIERYTCSEPSDSSSGQLFINSERKFLSKLKTAKRLVIEAEFFQAGRKQMVFNVASLEFPGGEPAGGH
jgi:hypothetical protein